MSHAAHGAPNTIAPSVSMRYKAQTIAVVDGSLNLLSIFCHFFFSLGARQIYRVVYSSFESTKHQMIRFILDSDASLQYTYDI